MGHDQVLPCIRVVLADDHAAVRGGIRQFLEQAEDIAIVGEAKDGTIALALIEQLEPDIAILDIQMPKVNGLDISRAIHAQCWPVRVLMLTSYEDDPYIAAVLKTGASAYVLKTASPSEMIGAVRMVYQGKPLYRSSWQPE